MKETLTLELSRHQAKVLNSALHFVKQFFELPKGTPLAEQIVRCPYCVLDDQSRLMLQRPGWFICEQCGHVAIPEDPDFKCSCRNCPKVKRAA